MLSAVPATDDFTVETTEPDPVETPAAEVAAAAEPTTDDLATESTEGKARDEKGRFVSAKPAEPEAPAVEAAAPAPAQPEPPAADEQAVDPDIDVDTGLKKNARPYQLVRKFQQQAESVTRENQQLRDTIAQLQRTAQSLPPAKEQAPSPASLDLGPRPSLDDFGSWGEWLAADTVWHDKRIELRAKELIEAERAQFTQALSQRDEMAQFNALTEKGRAKYPDFDAVVATAAQQGAYWSESMKRIVLSSPHAEHLAYALAKDVGEARRLAAIADPLLVGLEMGQLLTRIAVASTTGTTAPVKTQTQAKAPLKPVGASATVSDGAPPDDADFDSHLSHYNRLEKRAIPIRRS